jgi:flagella basal body P-ring formation protein FlgA
MFNPNGNGRPLSKKKQVQLMVALTILAWATQTLRHQWGFGADIAMVAPDAQQIVPQPGDPADSTTAASADAAPTTAPSEDADDAVAGKEAFVPGADRFAQGATLEMRSEATIIGSEIKLRQICRWSDDDKAVFAPVADFVIARIKPASPFRNISITELKSVLHDAGINLATINIVGASACTVSRSDTAYDEHTALQQWIDAKEGDSRGGNTPATQPDAGAQAGAQASCQASSQASSWSDGASQGVSVSTATAAAAVPAAATEEKQYHTLRDLLTQDLATRINLPVDQLQMNFRAEDEKVLALSEPSFQFQIDPVRVRNLGDVSWNVSVIAGGETHQVTINAEGRAWQQQLVLARPLDSRQVIQPDDVIERRTLVDSLPNDPLLTRDQLVNEQSAENLKPGTVMTARMVDALPLVRSGQFVTVTIQQGGVQIKTVATAMESGSYGQTIRVRNEETREIFEVTLTGPQEATMNSVGGTSIPSTAAGSGSAPLAAP